MGTTSQASYAARLARAEQFYQFISTFQNFDPGMPELTPIGFQNLIVQLSSTQSEHTVKHHDYAEAAKERKKVFTTNPDSIAKTLTRVNAYVRARKGKDSQQYIDVNTLVKKIRGERPVTVTINASEETISRSEKSYGSQLQNFTDVITLLQRYNGDYAPTTEVGIPALQILQRQATSINNSTNSSYGAFKPKINERQKGFRNLNETANRIKEMVKSQYGSTSVEYNLIKGLNFSSNM